MAGTALVARVLVALIFLLSGLQKFFNVGGTTEIMVQHQIPFIFASLLIAIAVELGAGVALLLGWWTRVAASALVIFLIPTTLIFHTNLVIVHETSQAVELLKNLAIIGGLLSIAANGAGGFSLDARRRVTRLTL